MRIPVPFSSHLNLTLRLAASSATLVNDDAPPTVEPDVQVNLLSRQAGQPWLARVAEELATGDLSKEMTSEEIAETIDCARGSLLRRMFRGLTRFLRSQRYL